MAVFYEKRDAPCWAGVSHNMEFPAHIHRDVELVRALEGELSVTVDGHQKLLKNGECALVFPHTVHSYGGGRNSRVQMVIFSTALAGGYARTLEATRPRRPFLSKGEVHPDVPYVMERLLAGADGAPPRGILQGYLLLAVGRLLEKMELEESPAGRDAGLVARTLAFVDENAAEPLTLQQIADALGVSKYHLSHSFGQKLGTSLHQHINAVRVQRALGLLQQGVPASTAGYAAGFESASTFYRVFRGHVGTSPGAYTKNALAGTGRPPAEKAGAEPAAEEK